VELAPRDPQDAPALGVEGAVAGAVALERGSRRMGLVAVELDDEALPAPGEVGFDLRRLVEVDLLVDEWPGEALGFEERQEAAFELASAGGRLDAVQLDQPSQGRSPRPPGVARDEGGERGRARSLDLTARRVADAPEGCCRPVAQCRAVGAGEDGRQPVAVPGECGMADRVHPAVQHMQAPGCDAAVDGIEGEAERPELSPCHDTVLRARMRRDGRVDPTRPGFTAHIAVDPACVEASLDRAASRVPVQHAIATILRSVRPKVVVPMAEDAAVAAP
jgi:hypothetical protein